MGAAIGPIIAAAVARAEREYVEHFRMAGATLPERSIPLPEFARPLVRRRADGWLESGVLRPGPGGYWLDEAAYVQHGAQRRTRVLLVLAIVLLVLLAVGVGTLLRDVHLAQ